MVNETLYTNWEDMSDEEFVAMWESAEPQFTCTEYGGTQDIHDMLAKAAIAEVSTLAH